MNVAPQERSSARYQPEEGAVFSRVILNQQALCSECAHSVFQICRSQEQD